LGRRDQGRRGCARPRRHHLDRAASPWSGGQRGGPGRLHRGRVVAGGVRRDPLRRQQGRDRGGGGGQRGTQPRRPDLQHSPAWLPTGLDQPVQPLEPGFGCDRRRRGSPTPRNAWPRPRSGPLKAEKVEKPEGKEGKELKLEKNEKVERKEVKEVKLEKNEKLEIEGRGFGGGLEERVGALEQAMGQLSHFITTEMRPDLSLGALSGETDYPQLSGNPGGGKSKEEVEKLREQG